MKTGDGHSWATAYRIAIRARSRGCNKEAARRLHELVKANPVEPVLRRELGNTLLKMGEADDSIVHFKGAACVVSNPLTPQTSRGGSEGASPDERLGLLHFARSSRHFSRFFDQPPAVAGINCVVIIVDPVACS
jgi:hypothetical protein